MTDDSAPIFNAKHPRNTVLGASLVLEGLLIDLTKEQINRASTALAKEFQEEIEKAKESRTREILDMIDRRCTNSRVKDIYSKSLSDFQMESLAILIQKTFL